MLDEVVRDYAAYFKLDVSNGFQTVQDVIDNMLTRLEELTSVLQMIRLKNGDCSKKATEDIIRYRSEITALSKKVATLNEVMVKLQNNADIIEKQVQKAEIDFGVQNENKLRSFFKPLLAWNKQHVSESSVNSISSPDKILFQSVMDNFMSSQ